MAGAALRRAPPALFPEEQDYAAAINAADRAEHRAMKYYLGVDLGGTGIKAAVIDEQYHILSTHKIPTLAKRPFEEVVADMGLVANKALESAGLSPEQLEHVGIGVPSTLYPDTRNIVFANNLNWRNRDVLGEFQKHLNLPAYIANDADCAAYGEVLAGVASGCRNVMMITLGTGVGGGIIWDKKIFLGGTGYGSEPGHTLIAIDGEPCTCGQRGCLEAYASVTAFIRDTKRAMQAHPESVMHELCEQDINRVSGRTAFAAARAGDEAGKGVVENYIHYLSVGIASFITLLRPEAIILGGGLSGEGEYLLSPLRRAVHEKVYASNLLPQTPIICANLGNDAGLVGAAFLGIQYRQGS